MARDGKKKRERKGKRRILREDGKKKKKKTFSNQETKHGVHSLPSFSDSIDSFYTCPDHGLSRRKTEHRIYAYLSGIYRLSRSFAQLKRILAAVITIRGVPPIRGIPHVPRTKCPPKIAHGWIEQGCRGYRDRWW